MRGPSRARQSGHATRTVEHSSRPSEYTVGVYALIPVSASALPGRDVIFETSEAYWAPEQHVQTYTPMGNTA